MKEPEKKEPPKPEPLRLVRMKYTGPALPSGPPLHGMVAQDFTRDIHPTLEGWSMSFRGAAAFLVSPAGWSHGKKLSECSGKGKVHVIGPIPMVHLLCEWEGDDAGLVDKIQRFDTSPFARIAAAPSDTTALDPKEMGDP